MTDIRVFVATHKEYPMPEDDIYIPVMAGSVLRDTVPEGYQRDDTGDNISDKNREYSELTVLYWAYKNASDADYAGLVHYRRRLGSGRNDITGSELQTIIDGGVTVIVPAKRRYVIESLYSHYAHTHGEEHLKVMKRRMEKVCPELIPYFDKTLSRTWGYMFNMCIMRFDLLERYCGILFPLLDEITGEIGYDGMSDFDRRYPGRLSELFFNIWLEYMLGSGNINVDQIMRVPFFQTEKVNIIKKGGAFLRAKFGNKKYRSGF